MKKKLSVKINGEKIEESDFDYYLRSVFPKWGGGRFQSKVQTAMQVFGYEGASRTLKEFQTAKAHALSPDDVSDWNRQTAVDRCRDFVRNNTVASSIITAASTNVIGTGIKCRARVDADYLGITEAEALEINKTLDREWKLFSLSKDCDIRRSCNFYELQDLVLRSVLTSGDAFTLLLSSKSPNDLFTTKIQVVEGELVSNPDNKPNSDDLFHGVEKDKFGAPERYWFSNKYPSLYSSILTNTQVKWQAREAYDKKTGKRVVLHHYMTQRPGQTRGDSILLPVAVALQQISKLTQAELMASVITSFLTVITSSSSGDGVFKTQPNQQAAHGNNKSVELGHGSIIELDKDTNVTVVDPKRPNGNFEPFFRAIVRQIGASVGIPGEVIMNQFNDSFSAAKAALLQAWKKFLMWRQFLINDFCVPVREAFIEELVLTGIVDFPGFFQDKRIRAAYLSCVWAGDARGSIEENKQVDAAIKRINANISTIAEETIALTGGDFESNIRQRSQELLKINSITKQLEGPEND